MRVSSIVFVVLSFACAARADVIGVLPPCPEGTSYFPLGGGGSARSTHRGGPRCEPVVCSGDAVCGPDRRCRTDSHCVATRGERTLDLHRCSADGRCGDGARCMSLSRCFPVGELDDRPLEEPRNPPEVDRAWSVAAVPFGEPPWMPRTDVPVPTASAPTASAVTPTTPARACACGVGRSRPSSACLVLAGLLLVRRRSRRTRFTTAATGCGCARGARGSRHPGR